jgi:tRNA-specific adenosine deaminase 1
MARGNILHDSHAEIVAIRAFNCFLLNECIRLARDTTCSSSYVQRRQSDEITETSPQPFAIQRDVSIHMYGSEAPCGDASMELIMAAQEDATPWDLAPATDADTTLKGRGSFAELGIVRRKPARPDAPPTLSKSCTDKLAMYQYTSILNSITSLLVLPENAYLSTLTLPASQYVAAAITRAFTTSGRLSELNSEGDSGYHFHPFTVQTTDLEFAWSRRALPAGEKAIASNISAVHTVHLTETLINGVLQGRKIGDPKGASKICRTSLWKAAVELVSLLDSEPGREVLKRALSAESYAKLKTGALLGTRRKVKEEVRQGALKGWIRNDGDEMFGLD